MNNSKRANIRNKFKNINKKTKCNSLNQPNLINISNILLNEYDIDNQIILHKLISNLFIRGSDDTTIDIIKTIIDNIQSKVI